MGLSMGSMNALPMLLLQKAYASPTQQCKLGSGDYPGCWHLDFLAWAGGRFWTGGGAEQGVGPVPPHAARAYLLCWAAWSNTEALASVPAKQLMQKQVDPSLACPLTTGEGNKHPLLL